MVAIAAGVALIAIAAALVADAFQGHVVFFFSPSQVAAKEAPLEQTFRVGGMVEKGSLSASRRAHRAFRRHRHPRKASRSSTRASFRTSSRKARAWRAGAAGPRRRISASEVLAKHDENSMPPKPRTPLSKAEAEKAAKSVVGGQR